MSAKCKNVADISILQTTEGDFYPPQYFDQILEKNP